MFWLHDTYKDGDGFRSWRLRPVQVILCFLTILIGAFICVAGMYAVITAIVDAYASGTVPRAFSC